MFFITMSDMWISCILFAAQQKKADRPANSITRQKYKCRLIRLVWVPNSFYAGKSIKVYLGPEWLLPKAKAQ